MFKAALLLSSLSFSEVRMPPIEKPRPTNTQIYINASEGRPAFPRAKSSFGSSPIRNEDLISEGIEDIIYKTMAEELKD